MKRIGWVGGMLALVAVLSIAWWRGCTEGMDRADDVGAGQPPRPAAAESDEQGHTARPRPGLPSDDSRPITAVREIAESSASDVVGRPVQIDGATVMQATNDRGFWIGGDDGHRAYVLPGDAVKAEPRQGQRVSIDGLVQRMPNDMRQRLQPEASGLPPVYIFAWAVTQ